MFAAWVRLPRQCLSVSRIRSRSTSATVRPTRLRVTCSAAVAAWVGTSVRCAWPSRAPSGDRFKLRAGRASHQVVLRLDDFRHGHAELIFHKDNCTFHSARFAQFKVSVRLISPRRLHERIHGRDKADGNHWRAGAGVHEQTGEELTGGTVECASCAGRRGRAGQSSTARRGIPRP